MNKLQKLILAILICMIGQICVAQDFSNADIDATIDSYTPTPQTWAFIRYGSIPVDHYTGKAMLTIPIYTYKDNDFELPISVGYVSEGFQPGRQTGILGLNWYLNCGGTISREIKGVADDHINQHGHGCIGFLQAQANYSENDLLELNIGGLDSQLKYYCTGSGSSVETSSDVYHFNFPGHSGTFHFDGDRQIHVYNTNGNNGTYTITHNDISNSRLKRFTIKTADGYEYTFGSDNDEKLYNTTERHLSGKLTGNAVYTFSNSNISEHPIVTWNLTQIKAPNGRSVSFTYEDVNLFTGTYINASTANNPFLVTSFSPGRCEVQCGVEHSRNVGIVQTTYLKSITIDDCTIEFSMSLKDCYDRPNKPYVIASHTDDHCITQNLKKLDGIRVENGSGRELLNTSFSYKVKNNRLILTSIHTDGLGSYTMDYHEEYPYPAISTPDTDFWGFYNGKGNTYDVVAGSIVNEYYEDKIVDDVKLPDWRYSRLGCLKRIAYPTNGYTEFDYESNRAQKIVLKREYPLFEIEVAPSPDSLEYVEIPEEAQERYLVDAHAYNSLFDTDEAGGVRVRRIVYYDGLGGFQSRDYFYDNGTVHAFPKWYVSALYGYQTLNPHLEFPANTLDQQTIGYGRVREVFADGSYVIHYYNDYNSHPDEYNGQCRKKSMQVASNMYLYKPSFINNILRDPNSNHMKRGKLNQQEFYDKDNILVKKIAYEYAMHNEDAEINYTAYVKLSGFYANSTKRYTGDYRMTKMVESEYHNGVAFVTSHEFEYDNYGRKTLTTLILPDGRVETQGARYLTDTTRHLFNMPYVQYQTIQQTGGMQQLSNVTSIRYATFNNLLKPACVRKAKLSDAAWYTTQFDALNYRAKQTFVEYDTFGNPTEIRNEHGVHTAYLWGYGGKYPIVQAVNMTAVTLRNLLGITDNQPLEGSLTESQRTLLHTSNAQSLIEVFEYEPMVGVTKRYDQNGKCITYEYDQNERLCRISDEIGGLKSYSYSLDGSLLPSWSVDHIIKDPSIEIVDPELTPLE